jgi:glycosyltransferase involved in cell wall biosynthesis
MINQIRSYSDYKLTNESINYLNSDNVILAEAKTLSTELDKNIKFGIIVATYRIDVGRGKKGNVNKTPKIIKDLLDSVFAQSHKNFKIYICADAYPEEYLSELTEIIDKYPKGQVWFHNLAKSVEQEQYAKNKETNKKYPGEDKYGITSYMHGSGGCTPFNNCLDQIRKDGIKYIAKLDHDDKWDTKHLEQHAKAYTQFPDAHFVATRATKRAVSGNNIGDLMYVPGFATKEDSVDVDNIEYNNAKLNPQQPFSGSAISWKAENLGTLRFRPWDDQLSKSPRRKEVSAGDVDFYMRVVDIMKKKDLKLVYVPVITCRMRNNEGKF